MSPLDRPTILVLLQGTLLTQNEALGTIQEHILNIFVVSPGTPVKNVLVEVCRPANLQYLLNGPRGMCLAGCGPRSLYGTTMAEAFAKIVKNTFAEVRFTTKANAIAKVRCLAFCHVLLMYMTCVFPEGCSSISPQTRLRSRPYLHIFVASDRCHTCVCATCAHRTPSTLICYADRIV